MIFKYENKIINLSNVCYVKFNKSAILFVFAGETELNIYPKEDYDAVVNDI